MAPPNKKPKEPQIRQAISVQLAAFLLFGGLAYSGAIRIDTFNPSWIVGILILAIAAGVPPDVWVDIARTIMDWFTRRRR